MPGAWLIISVGHRFPGPGTSGQRGLLPRTLDLPDGIGYFRHIGIYGYRASVLSEFVTWLPAPTERVESLEQLRALYNGALIHVDVADRPPAPGVDTEEDLARLRALMEKGGARG